MKKYLTVNVLVPLGMIIFGAFWLSLALDLGAAGLYDTNLWGTGATFPKLLLSIFIALNIWTLINEILKASKVETAETGEKNKEIWRVVLMVAVLFAYTFILPIITFIPATIILLVISMLMFNERRKVLLVVAPVVITLILYGLFTFALKIFLP